VASRVLALEHNAENRQVKVGSDTYYLTYDAENRLSQVKKNSTLIATITYDGDGNRVKSVMGAETTLFIGVQYGRSIRKDQPGRGTDPHQVLFCRRAQRVT